MKNYTQKKVDKMIKDFGWGEVVDTIELPDYMIIVALEKGSIFYYPCFVDGESDLVQKNIECDSIDEALLAAISCANNDGDSNPAHYAKKVLNIK